ncbi:hypothetical protein A4X13_0g8770, partial [Tilletia indica]
PEELNDHMLFTHSPPLDLLVRTSGVRRLSDFMLWQASSSNTQLCFVDVYWPQFGLRHLIPILLNYQRAVWARSRQEGGKVGGRRVGGVASLSVAAEGEVGERAAVSHRRQRIAKGRSPRPFVLLLFIASLVLLVAHLAYGLHWADPDKFSLLTKTEVKEDYLLTDSELRDPELLPHLLRPNPHKATYSNMMLFLRCQVESYAFGPNRWGSPEELDAELTRRQEAKAQRRGKKFVEEMKGLRMRTRDARIAKRNEEAAHEHRWVGVDGQVGQQVCETCGQEIEVEEF